MKSSLKDIIKRFEIFSDLDNEESNEIVGRFDKDGLGIAYGDESRKLIMTPYPRKAEMIAFLEELPDHIVFSLLVLMYSGREGVKDVKDHWLQLRETFTSKDLAVEFIQQKPRRCEHIEKGIQYLGEKQIEEFAEYIHSTLRA